MKLWNTIPKLNIYPITNHNNYFARKAKLPCSFLSERSFASVKFPNWLPNLLEPRRTKVKRYTKEDFCAFSIQEVPIFFWRLSKCWDVTNSIHLGTKTSWNFGRLSFFKFIIITRCSHLIFPRIKYCKSHLARKKVIYLQGGNAFNCIVAKDLW